jgi:two-component system, chemotaxis family, chemotaxis protein CheY
MTKEKDNMKTQSLNKSTSSPGLAVGPATILIVDDEPFILSAASRILRDAGFVVYTCELWAKVSSFARRTQPDLILLDYDMTSLNGAEVCGILKQELGDEVKVVIFSATDRDELDEDIRENMADGYIKKTISPPELVGNINNFITGLSVEAKGRNKLSPKKILTVDDSPIMRKLLRQTLKRLYKPEIIEATNGKEALDILVKNPDIDLIMLDINMPIMNGLQLLKSLRMEAEAHRAPVIICSTEGEEADVLNGLRLGAKGYLKKPFTAVAIRSLVDSVLGKTVEH